VKDGNDFLPARQTPENQKKAATAPGKIEPVSYRYYSVRPKLDRLSTKPEKPARARQVKPSFLKVGPRKGGILTGDLSGLRQAGLQALVDANLHARMLRDPDHVEK
jgi:hypothetical protein